MKRLALLSLLAAAAPWTGAQQQEQARVLSATPIVQQIAVPQQVCGNETVYTGPQTTGGGAVLGAIAGGAAGNAVGGGSGRAVATAIGLIGGALLGNQIEGSGRPAYQNVQRCDTQTFYENRTVGYTVVYEYAGRQYTTQTPDDPGNYLDVQVRPLDQNAPSAYGTSYSTQPDPYQPPSAYATPQGAIAMAQPGVVVSTYGQPVYPAVYPATYPAPMPLYMNPGVSLNLGFSRGWNRPYGSHGHGGHRPHGHGHPRHWR